MKRMLLVALVCVVCCLLTVGVLADGAAAFVHTDEESGLRLTVPEGWSAPEISQNEHGTYAIFHSLSYPDLVISLTTSDLFSRTTPANIQEALQRSGEPRKHVDNEYFPKETIAEILQCSADDITEVTYSGRTYYHINANFLLEDGNYKECAILLHLENGIVYMFLFSGRETHPSYEDFLCIVSEAEYPHSEDEKTIMVRELLIVLLSLMLHPIPVIVYRYGIRRCPLDDAKMVCAIYAVGATVLAIIIMGFLNESEVGAVLLGIVPAALLNYRMLSK